MRRLQSSGHPLLSVADRVSTRGWCYVHDEIVFMTESLEEIMPGVSDPLFFCNTLGRQWTATLWGSDEIHRFTEVGGSVSKGSWSVGHGFCGFL